MAAKAEQVRLLPSEPFYRRVLVNNTDSKPVKESSILLRRCQFVSWGEPGGPGACLQNTRTRFDSTTPLHYGVLREQANPADCDSATDRIDTDKTPQARISQW